MHTFTDTVGRTWSPVVNIDAIRRVRQLVSVDLMQVAGPLLEQLSGDPVLMFDVLAAVCKPQLDAAQVTPSALADALVGDSLDQAGAALLAAIADFYPTTTRTLFRQVLEAGKQNRAVAHERAMLAVEQMTRDIQRLSVDP